MSFKLTRRQELAHEMLGRDQMHTLLDGGSQSGKTFTIVRAISIRALAVPDTNHGIFRFRLSHVNATIAQRTFPDVMRLCWPQIGYKYDKNESVVHFPNKSRIWFGGLDDKDRTEKVLGTGFSTVYLNECSQIPWGSRNMVTTRLSENKGLRPRAWYDCNPPSETHWTNRVFHEKRDPITRKPLPDPEEYAAFKMNPRDNEENLTAAYLKQLQNLPLRERMRFWEGRYGDASLGQLWTVELLDQQRCTTVPDFARVIIAVDPSGCEGEEDKRSDEIGIIVIGLGADGMAYILEDLSMRGSPMEWGTAVCEAFDRYEANCVVAEVNFGGAMVHAVIQAARAAQKDTSGRPVGGPPIPYREVRASRGKAIRAEPVSTLFETQKVWLAGTFPSLEEQMLGMLMSGYTGIKSPDRLDAMVHGVHHLFPAVAKRDAAAQPEPQVIVGRGNRQQVAVQTGRRWR